MTSLSNIWDNETWLVLMGGGLFGAFLAYGTILSFYIPIMLMVFD